MCFFKYIHVTGSTLGLHQTRMRSLYERISDGVLSDCKMFACRFMPGIVFEVLLSWMLKRQTGVG